MDLRNTYIVSGLAMVEHLQPGYVISKAVRPRSIAFGDY